MGTVVCFLALTWRRQVRCEGACGCVLLLPAGLRRVLRAAAAVAMTAAARARAGGQGRAAQRGHQALQLVHLRKEGTSPK
jgi:hypothetical protein